MAVRERLICASVALSDGGKGVSFDVPFYGAHASGFVVRYAGKAYGYLNQCAHVPVTLDWQQDDFFDLTRQYLICSAHGAHYEPDSGYCVMGPCTGKQLLKLNVIERDDNIYLVEMDAPP